MRLLIIPALLTLVVTVRSVYAQLPAYGSGPVSDKCAPDSMPYPYVRTSADGRGIFVSTGNPYVRTSISYALPHHISGDYYAVYRCGIELKYWKARSGFCYPWAHGQSFYPYNSSVISISYDSAVIAEPPVIIVINDMHQFLSFAHEEGKLTGEEYLYLSGRLHNLEAMWKTARLRGEGAVDLKDEQAMRRRLMRLSCEISVSLDA